MPAAPARVADRTTIDNRRILLTLEHPIIGLDAMGPNQEPVQFAVETVLIHAIRDVTFGGGWALGVVEVRGHHRVDGKDRLTLRREYHPDHVTDHRYHHAEMPTELAKLVHDEIAEPDAGDDRGVAEAVRIAEDWASTGREEIHTAVAVALYDRAQAWAALPDSVRGDNAPKGATLAQRIKALGGALYLARLGQARCHARHIHLEPAVAELLGAVEGYDPALPEEVRRRLDDLAQAKDDALTAARQADLTVEPTLTVRWDDDETVSILVGGRAVGIVSHESSGWDGMRDVIGIVTAAAKTLGLPVVTEGVSNL